MSCRRSTADQINPPAALPVGAAYDDGEYEYEDDVDQPAGIRVLFDAYDLAANGVYRGDLRVDLNAIVPGGRDDNADMRAAYAAFNAAAANLPAEPGVRRELFVQPVDQGGLIAAYRAALDRAAEVWNRL